MKMLSMMLILMSLVGCGMNSNPVQNEEAVTKGSDPIICGKSLSRCMQQMEWRLFKKAKNFPSKIALSVNGEKIFDDCRPTIGRVRIERISTNIIIYLQSNYAPKDNRALIEIDDRGENCRQNTLYYSHHVDFQVAIASGRRYFTADLDR